MVTGEEPVVVHLDGEIDLGRADELCERLAVARRLTDDIVIDLRDVTFIDSTGIGVLAHAVRRGAELDLRDSAAQVQRALARSGLLDPVEPVQP